MIHAPLSLEQLSEKIHKNKKYKRLIEAFKTQKIYNINLDEFKEEILALHQARSIRTLIKFCDDNTAKMVDQVIRANAKDQGQRGRLTEILLLCTRASSALTEAIKVFKDYALLRYDPYLKRIKTKGERSSFLDTVLSDMQSYVEDCNVVINLARIVIDDIDRGGWSLSRTIDALALSSTKERRI